MQALPCLTHTVQLVVNDSLKDTDIHNLPTKVRRLVRKVYTCSIGTEKLFESCKKSLLDNVVTRWNSTYLMSCCLLELRNDITQLFD